MLRVSPSFCHIMLSEIQWNGCVFRQCPTLTTTWPVGSSVHGILQDKNTGVVCHFLLPEIFPTQGSNLGLLYFRQTLYQLSHLGNPIEGASVNYSQDSENKTWLVCMLSHFSPVQLQPYGPQPTMLLCLWDSPGKNTGVGCHASFRGSSWPRNQTRVSLHLLHWQESSLPLAPPGELNYSQDNENKTSLEVNLSLKVHLFKQCLFDLIHSKEIISNKFISWVCCCCC